MPSVEKKILNKDETNAKDAPPIRETKILNPKSGAVPTASSKSQEAKTAEKKLNNKSPKPKDYGEWNKYSLILFEKINYYIEKKRSDLSHQI